MTSRVGNAAMFALAKHGSQTKLETTKADIQAGSRTLHRAKVFSFTRIAAFVFKDQAAIQKIRAKREAERTKLVAEISELLGNDKEAAESIVGRIKGTDDDLSRFTRADLSKLRQAVRLEEIIKDEGLSNIISDGQKCTVMRDMMDNIPYTDPKSSDGDIRLQEVKIAKEWNQTAVFQVLANRCRPNDSGTWRGPAQTLFQEISERFGEHHGKELAEKIFDRANIPHDSKGHPEEVRVRKYWNPIRDLLDETGEDPRSTFSSLQNQTAREEALLKLMERAEERKALCDD